MTTITCINLPVWAWEAPINLLGFFITYIFLFNIKFPWTLNRTIRNHKGTRKTRLHKIDACQWELYRQIGVLTCTEATGSKLPQTGHRSVTNDKVSILLFPLKSSLTNAPSLTVVLSQDELNIRTAGQSHCERGGPYSSQRTTLLGDEIPTTVALSYEPFSFASLQSLTWVNDTNQQLDITHCNEYGLDQ